MTAAKFLQLNKLVFGGGGLQHAPVYKQVLCGMQSLRDRLAARAAILKARRDEGAADLAKREVEGCPPRAYAQPAFMAVHHAGHCCSKHWRRAHACDTQDALAREKLQGSGGETAAATLEIDVEDATFRLHVTEKRLRIDEDHARMALLAMEARLAADERLVVEAL